MTYVGHSIKNCFNFKNRASRAEYWFFIIFCYLFYFMTAITITIYAEDPNTSVGLVMFLGIMIVLSIIPNISLTCRRLHDIGFSGWWQLLFPFVFGIPYLIIGLIRGQSGENEYGSPPKYT